MPTVALKVQVELPLAGRWLLAHLEEGALDCELAIGDLTDLEQEVSRLNLRTDYLRVVVNVNFFSKYSTLLILFLYKLVADLNYFLNSLLSSNDSWLVLLQGKDHRFLGNLVRLFLRQTLLDRLPSSLV